MSDTTMNPSKAFEQLMMLLARGFGATPRAPGQRLPRGRCACHEPTVKWCGRHGQPLKRPR